MRIARLFWLIVIHCMMTFVAYAQGEEDSIFLCAFVQDGLSHHGICDAVEDFEVRFRSDPLLGDTGVIHCQGRSITVLSHVDNTMVGSRGKVIFIHHQRWLDEWRLRTMYVTVCAGSIMDGYFDWNRTTGRVVDRQVLRMTR